MAGRVYTDPAKFADALRRFATKEKDRAIVNGIRRGMTYARSLAVKSFMATGIGRGIFGHGRKKDTKAVKLIINRMKVRQAGTRIEAGLSVKGVAALQEKGGRTKAHPIRPRRGRFLAFSVGGRDVFVPQVQHPGSRIVRAPFAEPAMRRALPRINQEVERGLAAIAKQVLG